MKFKIFHTCFIFICLVEYILVGFIPIKRLKMKQHRSKSAISFAKYLDWSKKGLDGV